MKKVKSAEFVNCLEIKRQVQESIYEQTRHMTPEQEIRWYRRQVAKGPFRDWMKKTANDSTSL